MMPEPEGGRTRAESHGPSGNGVGRAPVWSMTDDARRKSNDRLQPQKSS
jgi:hypothetical protein